MKFGNIVVAPLVGAWIEIKKSPIFRISQLSLPSWERGLKLQTVWDPERDLVSLPSWERGLKFPQRPSAYMNVVGRSPRGSVD